jgi:hypothetical protein
VSRVVVSSTMCLRLERAQVKVSRYQGKGLYSIHQEVHLKVHLKVHRKVLQVLQGRMYRTTQTCPRQYLTNQALAGNQQGVLLMEGGDLMHWLRFSLASPS